MTIYSRILSTTAVVALSSLCVLVTVSPFLHDYIVGHDMLYHLSWNELFQAQFRQGDIYPRWLFEMKGGRGSPVFYFYSPLPYYLNTFFSMFLPEASRTWLSFGVTCCFTLLLSALGVYWFLRGYCQRKTAYLCMVFYVLFPYHVLVDLYIRFAFAEFVAIAWVPFAFILVRKVVSGDKRSVYGLALIYALLILSHIPTTLLVSPFLLLYGYFAAVVKRHSFGLIKGMSLGVALSALYLFPIIELRQFVSIDRMTKGDLYYRNAFLMTDFVLTEERAGLWVFLENMSFVALIVLVLSVLVVSNKTWRTWFWAVVSAFCLLMMYPVSWPVWEVFSILQIVQLPWRFYIVLSFTLFFLVAYAFSENVRTGFVRTISKNLIVTVLTASSLMTLYHCYEKISGNVDLKHQEIIKRSLVVRDGVQEYLPKQTPELYYEQVGSLSMTLVDELFSGEDSDIDYTYDVRGETLAANISTPIKQKIRLNQFYFPTWVCIDSKAGHEIELERSEDGFVTFQLPKGDWSLKLSHKRTGSELAGGAVSALAALWLVVKLFLNKSIRRKGLQGV